MDRSICVVAGEHQDWIVREKGGRELGHYPTRQDAEAVGYKLARKRKVELVVYDRAGKEQRRSRPAKGWLARLFAR
jgi:hypothetical protein